MQPDYNELAKRQQQNYQQSRDPFEYGQQVAKRRYSEIISGIDSQMSAAQKTYGDMYQEAMQRSTKAQAAGTPTLSGGMGQQFRDYSSALEMEQASQIGQARQQTAQDLFTQRQSAFANADLEGQQATQLQLQNQNTQLSLIREKNAITSSEDLTKEEKAEQLRVLGFNNEADAILKEEEKGDGTAFGDILLSLGIGVGVKVGAGVIGALGAKAGLGFLASNPVGWGIAALAATVYGVDKLSERFGWFNGDLIKFI